MSSSKNEEVLDALGAKMEDPTKLYDLLEMLGKGAYGAVYKAKNKNSGEVVAVKQINLDESEGDLIEVRREIAILKYSDII